MPRQLMTGRGVQWVLRTAKEQHGLTVDCGYDKVAGAWNVWHLTANTNMFTGCGKTPPDAYRNFLTVNNLNTESES